MLYTPSNFFVIILNCLAIICLITSLIAIVFADKIPKALLDSIAKLLLIFGSVTAFSYVQETLYSFFTNYEVGRYMTYHKVFGVYGWAFWLFLLSTGVVVQILWLKRYRQQLRALAIVSALVLVNIWASRYVLVAITLTHDFKAIP